MKKPGKVERNEGDVDKALASAAKVITAEYYAPHLAHATMEPPAAVARRMSDGKWEVWAPVQSPGGARDDIAKALGIKPEEMVVQPHAARRRLRPQVQVRLRHRGGAAVQGAGRRAGQGGVDARGRHASRLLPHRDGGALRGGPRRQQQGGRLAAPQRGADHPVHLRARPEASLRHRARHGLGRHAVRRAQHPHGERRGAEPRAHRLVPLGQQRGARLVDPVVRRRDGARSWARTPRTSCSS